MDFALRSPQAPPSERRHGALVVGGGAAGLSAALVLRRARVRTLVVDGGEQSNLSGVFAAGDLAMGRNVASAIATGTMAATGLRRSLLSTETAAP